VTTVSRPPRKGRSIALAHNRVMATEVEGGIDRWRTALYHIEDDHAWYKPGPMVVETLWGEDGDEVGTRNTPTPVITIADAQEIVDGLIKSRWWRGRWPRLTEIPITAGRKNSRTSRGGYHGIQLAPGMQNVGTLLHELAHVVVTHMSMGFQPHGPEFVAILLVLTRRHLGRALTAGLEQDLAKAGIRPRNDFLPKPAWTVEGKAALSYEEKRS